MHTHNVQMTRPTHINIHNSTGAEAISFLTMPFINQKEVGDNKFIFRHRHIPLTKWLITIT